MDGPYSCENIRFSRQTKTIILVIGLCIALWLFVRVHAVLGPFVWGAIIAYVLSPLVDWLEARTRLRRVWLVVLLYLAGLAVAAWVITVLSPIVVRQGRGLLADAPRILGVLLQRMDLLGRSVVAQELTRLGLSVDPALLANEVMRSAQGMVTYVTSHAIPAVFNVLEAVVQLIVALIISFYLLRGWPALRLRLPLLVPQAYRREALCLLADIDRVLGAYIRGQLLLIGIMAAANVAALSLLRVRYAVVIGLISGVLEVIPVVGPFMAGGIAVSVALFQPATPFGWSNLTLALAVALSYVLLRQIEDQLVVPNLMGPIVDLHPLLVLFALFAGSKLAGFTGLVVAVPAAAALKIILTYLYRKVWDEAPVQETAMASVEPAAAQPNVGPGETL
ncbi:MAG: AI-2E family transporter [Anaerolineae bacterium]